MIFPTKCVADTRSKLIQAGREVFLENGYRASMASIACRAGVAKQTLYNHFPTKDELFHEIARGFSDALGSTLKIDHTDLRQSLRSFGTEFWAKCMSSVGLSMFRVLINEAPKNPAFAKKFYETGFECAVGHLAEYFRTCMECGAIPHGDAHQLAETFFSMLLGMEHIKRLCFKMEPDVSVQKRIDVVVDQFLKLMEEEKSCAKS
ncbi:MAG TPA: TetR/AcrR family transcriptional regulator [Rhodocyclaceae bacterium]|nr:TetR/AcrR family transcriptional regulator [Rhodocyclaceae bacterium]